MRARMVALVSVAGAVVCSAAQPALAYVGPGAGVSLFGAAFGLIAAVVSAIGFVLLWPIRALLKKRRGAKAPGPDNGPAA